MRAVVPTMTAREWARVGALTWEAARRVRVAAATVGVADLRASLPRQQIEQARYYRGRRNDEHREFRIASPEMLPEGGALPHLICSPPQLGGGGSDEAGEHGNAR